MAKCKNCGDCCNHVAVEIDKPGTKKEYQEILWFLLHRGVKVYIDDEDDWYVEFAAPCDWRQEGRCINHQQRPGICGDYSSEECVNNGEGKAEKHSFSTYDEFMVFLRKKGIDPDLSWPKKVQ